MSLQVIKSIEGKDEYVLLPIGVYNALTKGKVTAKMLTKVKLAIEKYKAT